MKDLVASDTKTNNLAATYKWTTQRQPLRSTARHENEQLSATSSRSRWSLSLVADASDLQTNMAHIYKRGIMKKKKGDPNFWRSNLVFYFDSPQ